MDGRNRGRYDRSKLRYPSDLTDDEWALIEPFIPPARRRRQQAVDMREVMNGIMYVLTPAASGERSQKTFRRAARSTTIWTCGATTARSIASITRFMMECREQDDREASPTAAIIDSQSVKSAEKGGPASIRMAMMRARRSKARSAMFS